MSSSKAINAVYQVGFRLEMGCFGRFMPDFGHKKGPKPVFKADLGLESVILSI